jgi:hypothetical protein
MASASAEQLLPDWEIKTGGTSGLPYLDNHRTHERRTHMSIDTTKDHEVNKFDIGKAMKQTRIPLICIYDHPKDYPDKFIARLWDCDIPTNIMATADTLEELRAKIPSTMVRMNRDAQDDPCVVEVWI